MRKILICLAILITCAQEGVAAKDTRSIEIQNEELTLLGRLVVADGAKLSDGVLLLTHGTMAHMDMELIVSMQALFAERGISTLVHTLSMGVDRRKGAYDCAVPVKGSMQGDAADIIAWHKWLTSEGAANISLMGHSRGAVQSAGVAASHKLDGLTSVVMLAPAARRGYAAQQASYKERYNTDISKVLVVANTLIADGSGAQFIDVPGFMYCEDTKMTANSVASYFGPESVIPVKDIISGIDVPVLVVVGSNDKVVGDIATKLESVIDGKRVKFSLIEDADHFFYDFAGEDAADVIAEFLEDLKK